MMDLGTRRRRGALGDLTVVAFDAQGLGVVGAELRLPLLVPGAGGGTLVVRCVAADAGDAVLGIGAGRVLAGLLEETEVGGVALEALLLGRLVQEGPEGLTG